MAWALDRNHPQNPNRVKAYYTTATGKRLPKTFVPEFIDVGIDFSMLVHPVVIRDLEPFELANDLGL